MRIMQKNLSQNIKKLKENIDPSAFFAYNRNMENSKGNNFINRIHTALKIVLPILCLLTLGFIFGNSLQTSEQSAAQSSTVVDAVQDVASVIAPDSAIANATGEEYDKLHSIVRNMAHYLEFALLGALFCWTYYVFKPTKKYLYIPLIAFLIVPLLDESLQSFVSGRGSEWKDVGLDTLGGICGFAFALFVIWLVLRILRGKKQKNVKSE